MREYSTRVRFRLAHRWAPGRMSAYLDGELRTPQRGRMVRHLGECVECRRVFGELSVVVEALRRLPAARGVREPAEIATSVRIQLDQLPPV